MPKKASTQRVLFYIDEKAFAEIEKHVIELYGRRYARMGIYLRGLITKDMRANGYPDFDPGIINGGYRPRKSTDDSADEEETTAALDEM